MGLIEKNDLAIVFKRLRKTAGLSQIEMAKILDRDQATISRLEKGTQSLSLDSVFILSEYFDLRYEDLISGNINYWEISKNFNKPLKLAPKYQEDNNSVVRELVPLMRIILSKKGTEGLFSFLSTFEMQDLIYMSPSESISSLIYFDLLSSALETKLISEDDIPELVKITQSVEYHGSFYQVYENQKDSFDIVKAYCVNSPGYEGAIENNVMETSPKSITVGFKLKDVLEENKKLLSEASSFIINFKKAFFAGLPSTFGYPGLLAQAPSCKSLTAEDQVTIKLTLSI